MNEINLELKNLLEDLSLLETEAGKLCLVAQNVSTNITEIIDSESHMSEVSLIIRRLRKKVCQLRKVDVSRSFHKFIMISERLSKISDIKISLIFNTNKSKIDSSYVNDFEQIILHLIKQTFEKRLSDNKKNRGRMIRISCKENEETFVVSYEDDSDFEFTVNEELENVSQMHNVKLNISRKKILFSFLPIDNLMDGVLFKKGGNFFVLESHNVKEIIKYEDKKNCIIIKEDSRDYEFEVDELVSRERFVVRRMPKFPFANQISQYSVICDQGVVEVLSGKDIKDRFQTDTNLSESDIMGMAING